MANNMSTAVASGYNQGQVSAAASQAALSNSAAAAITAQQQFIINSFRGQIYISNQLDVEDTPVYDTIAYQAGGGITQSNSSFFTNVDSQSGKTPAQTSMDQNGKLDAPEAFSVFGVRLNWSEDILFADLITLLNSWAFQFILGKKSYQLANIRHS